MTTISPVSLPNLYELPTRSAETATQLTAGPSIGEKVAIDLRENPSTRTLPDEAIVHQPIVRYTQAQMEMRPVDRADAAFMAVIEPETFSAFIEAVKTDGDWRPILEGFSQKLAAHPEWLTNEAYRKAAAEILRKTNYF